MFFIHFHEINKIFRKRSLTYSQVLYTHLFKVAACANKLKYILIYKITCRIIFFILDSFFY